ncbi:MAG: hypothetical protein RL074_369 [Bacteroidota bacterium]
MYCFNVCKNCAPVAPSIVRWSHAKDNIIVLPTTIWPFLTTGFSTIAPTERIAELGWLMIELNSVIPNIPRLETVNVLPSISPFR